MLRTPLILRRAPGHKLWLAVIAGSAHGEQVPRRVWIPVGLLACLACLSCPPQCRSQERETPRRGEITVGKIARPKVKKEKSKPVAEPSRRIVVGPLVVRPERGEAWRETTMEKVFAELPQTPSNYVVANLSGRPEEFHELNDFIKRSKVRVLDSLPDELGFVLHADKETARNIARARDRGDAKGTGVVDLMVPVRPWDKLTRSLQMSLDQVDRPVIPGPILPNRPCLKSRVRSRSRLRLPGELAARLKGDTDARIAARDQGTNAPPIGAPAIPAPPGQRNLKDVVFYLFHDQPIEVTIKKIHEVGGLIVETDAGDRGKNGNAPDNTKGKEPIIRARVPRVKVLDVASLPEVERVVRDPGAVMPNDVATKVMLHNPPPVVLPFLGEGQVIGHADSGLDNGRNDATLHPAFRGRLRRAFPHGRASTNDWSDFLGHGTHTAGSIVGAGEFGGFAKRATLVHQSLVDEYGKSPIPILSKLLDEAYNEGARIHSNSWTFPIRDPGNSRTLVGAEPTIELSRSIVGAGIRASRRTCSLC